MFNPVHDLDKSDHFTDSSVHDQKPFFDFIRDWLVSSDDEDANDNDDCAPISITTADKPETLPECESPTEDGDDVEHSSHCVGEQQQQQHNSATTNVVVAQVTSYDTRLYPNESQPSLSSPSSTSILHAPSSASSSPTPSLSSFTPIELIIEFDDYGQPIDEKDDKSGIIVEEIASDIHLTGNSSPPPLSPCDIHDVKLELPSPIKSAATTTTKPRPRPYACDICQRRFCHQTTLVQHRGIHSMQRPHECETCGRSYNRQSTLIAHRRTHTDHKPFACHLCARSFYQKGNLKNHLYVHTNARPFQCPHCAAGFNQMSNMKAHVRRRHPEEEEIGGGKAGGVKKEKEEMEVTVKKETPFDGGVAAEFVTYVLNVHGNNGGKVENKMAVKDVGVLRTEIVDIRIDSNNNNNNSAAEIIAPSETNEPTADEKSFQHVDLSSISRSLVGQSGFHRVPVDADAAAE